MREGGETVRIQSPLGTALKKRRLNLGLSQEELANRAGLHRTYITDVERGSRNPSLETIQKLARALEVPLSEVFHQIESAVGEPGSAGGRGEAAGILVIEDDRGPAEKTFVALKKISIANPVHGVHDGADALDFVFSTGPHRARSPLDLPRLILLDLGVPGIGGLEVLRRIRADRRTRTIPVAVLTPSGSEGDMKACVSLGVEVFLAKPVDFSRFSEAVRRLGFQWLLIGTSPVA